MSLIKLNNGTKEGNVTRGFNDLFESMFQDTFMSDRLMSKVPAVNISESEGHYHIEMAAPGLKKEDFKIKLDRNLLTVSAEQQHHQEESDKLYNKREFSYSSFVRSFALPETADDAGIEATYADGILTIAVAKKEEAKQVIRQIEIK
jgi:HSP20 family protein